MVNRRGVHRRCLRLSLVEATRRQTGPVGNERGPPPAPAVATKASSSWAGSIPMLKKMMLDDLPRVRPDLDEAERERLAEKFADAYVHAAYKNADMIEQTMSRRRLRRRLRPRWMGAGTDGGNAELSGKLS